MKITHDLIKILVSYDPKTGLLKWNKRGREFFKTNRSFSSWNSKYGGKPCFVNNCHGYLCGTIFKKKYLAHRIIWFYVTGEWPDQVDHINGVKSDNRWGNLREVDKRENMKNTKRPITNTSGRVGVYWYEPYGKWLAKVSFKKGPKNLGYFDTFEEACEVRARAEKEFGFHENHGREK
jgi:hypothetical protein